LPQFRQYPQTDVIQPTDAFVLDRTGVGTMFVEGLGLVVNGPYIFSFSNTGLPLTASEIVGGHVFALACSVAANMPGSEVVVDPSSLPADTTVIVIDLIHNGVDTTLGSLTIHTDGSYVFSTAAFSAVPGDYFRMTGPLLFDTHLANIFFTGYGTITG
jgi:hypothetical protein